MFLTKTLGFHFLSNKAFAKQIFFKLVLFITVGYRTYLNRYWFLEFCTLLLLLVSY